MIHKRKKMGKLDLIKIKAFVLWKTRLQGQRHKLQTGRIYLQISDQVYNSKLNSKETNNLVKQWIETGTDIS